MKAALRMKYLLAATNILMTPHCNLVRWMQSLAITARQRRGAANFVKSGSEIWLSGPK